MTKNLNLSQVFHNRSDLGGRPPNVAVVGLNTLFVMIVSHIAFVAEATS